MDGSQFASSVVASGRSGLNHLNGNATDLSDKLDKTNSDLTNKIDTVNTNLTNKIDKTNSDLNGRFIMLLIGVVVAIVGGYVGMAIALFQIAATR